MRRARVPSFPCFRQIVQHLQLGHRLHIEAEDIVVEPDLYLAVGLAHAGKGDLVGGEATFQCPQDLVAAHAVGAKTIGGDEPQDLRVGIGLMA